MTAGAGARGEELSKEEKELMAVDSSDQGGDCWGGGSKRGLNGNGKIIQ